MAKTAFVVPGGHYEYTRMPFGLKNAPGHFQRAMDQTFKHLGVSPYIDDLVVATESWKDHLDKLKEVFQICKEKNITLKLSKCVFGTAKLQYLGHVVGSGDIVPPEARTAALSEFPRPETRRQLKRFLGMANYYRQHVPGYARLAGELEKITGRTSPKKVEWTEIRERAFKELRAAIGSPKILSAPDLDKPFILTTDACSTGIGAELTQEDEGRVKWIGFYSHRLKPSQRNYSATEQETFAIQMALRHFAPVIAGTEIIIRTDHKPTTYLD